MKKIVKYSICTVAAFILLTEPIMVSATESGSEGTILESEEILSAGVDELFGTVLTETEYI